MRRQIEMSPQDAQFWGDTIITSMLDQVKYDGLQSLDERQRTGFVAWVYMQNRRYHRRMVDIAEQCDLSYMTISRLKNEYLEKLEVPASAEANKDLIVLAEAHVARYSEMSENSDPEDKPQTHRLLTFWVQELAKLSGAYAAVRVDATVVEVTAAERELQELIAQQERDNAMATAQTQWPATESS